MSKRKSIFDSVGPISQSSSSDDTALQLEQIDQEISKTLSMIHYNLDICNDMIRTRLIPILMKYRDNSRQINNSTRFLKNLFENSLNVNIQVQKADEQRRGVNIDEMAKQVEISANENAMSESILVEESARDKSERTGDSSTIPKPKVSLAGKEIIDKKETEQDKEVETNDESLETATTPTGKRELNNLFASRTKISDAATETSTMLNNSTSFFNGSVFLNNSNLLNSSNLLSNSIIDQGTSTFNLKDKASTAYSIQISPKKRPATGPQTPKRRKNRKSEAILEKLNIEDSPEDTPKTPELTYLKFSPIKLRKESQSKGKMEGSFFDSSADIGSPPVSTKFAVPKTIRQMEKSPAKALAKQYTQDYLDMEIDEDEESVNDK